MNNDEKWDAGTEFDFRRVLAASSDADRFSLTEQHQQVHATWYHRIQFRPILGVWWRKGGGGGDGEGVCVCVCVGGGVPIITPSSVLSRRLLE